MLSSMYCMELNMKRKRDLQGKFTRKNQTERQVRSLRLTDSTWKELGIASECLGITRADLLENLVRQNKETFLTDGEIEKLTQEINQLKQEIQSLHQEKSG